MTPIVRRVVAGATAFALLGLVALGGCGKKEEKASGFNGRFRGTVGQGGTQEITLSTSGSVVKMQLLGEEVEGRLVSPTRAEGTRTNHEGTFRFAFDLLGDDRISATFAVEAEGQRLDFPATTLQRVPEPAPASGGGSSGGGAGARDDALVGHWRHTEVLGSGGSHLVTDTHVVLSADGTFETWTKSAGMGTSSESERSSGQWKAEGGKLHFRDEGQAWVEVGRYSLSGDNLMITGNGGKRVYERV